MFKSHKKVLSSSLVGLFLAFLLFCSAHAHPQKNQNPEKENCSICQLSHSLQKQGLNPSSSQVLHFKSEERVILSSPEVSSSHFFFSSLSRAPPISI